MSEQNLITIEKSNAATVFAKGGMVAVVDQIIEKVNGTVFDMTTDEGRKACGSTAYAVSRSKTYLDDMGASLVKPLKDKAKIIDAERKYAREKLESLRDKVRDPLNKYEQAQKDRAEKYKAKIDLIHATKAAHYHSSEAVEKAIRMLNELQPTEQDYAEYTQMAETAVFGAVKVLESRCKQMKADEAKEAAAKLKREQAQAAREKQIAEQAAADAIAAKERADQAAADEAKRKAFADQVAKRQREQDLDHRRAINNAILSDFKAVGVGEEIGKALIAAIANGMVKNVKITY